MRREHAAEPTLHPPGEAVLPEASDVSELPQRVQAAPRALVPATDPPQVRVRGREAQGPDDRQGGPAARYAFQLLSTLLDLFVHSKY